MNPARRENAADAGTEPAGEGTRKTFPPLWAITTYFAQGFPYSLVRQISTVFFKDHGASLQALGLTALYRIPWVIKFLWAPLADAYAWSLALLALGIPFAMLLPMFGIALLVGALVLFLIGRYARA